MERLYNIHSVNSWIASPEEEMCTFRAVIEHGNGNET
jgi:hypothetical protein